MVVYPGVGMLLFIGLVKTGFSFSWFYSIMILDRWCWYGAYKLCFRNIKILQRSTWCPKKHGNSVTNWISSLLGISIVKPNFKSHNIIMPARVYFMKRVKHCKGVSIMSPQDVYSEDGQVYSVCILQFSCFTKCTLMQSKHKQTKCEHSRRNSYRLQLSLLGITILNRRIIYKDDIEFVTEFPC